MDRDTRGLGRFLVLSLGLHLAAGAPLGLSALHVHRSPGDRPQRLAIELFGMLSDRQTEASQRGGAAPRPLTARPPSSAQLARVARVARPAPPRAGPEQKPEPRRAAESPVSEGVQREPAEPEAAPTPALVAAGPGTGAEDQAQQMIRAEATQKADQIREYMVRLVKRIRAGLVYPEDLRRRGIEGIAKVGFAVTPSGEVKDGAVRVVRSSGEPALDASAVQAVLAAAPFERPVEELPVTIGMAFTAKLSRPVGR